MKLKIKDLKKNKNKSVRINDQVLELVEKEGLTLQAFLDQALQKLLKKNKLG